jgi:hypothetical protein
MATKLKIIADHADVVPAPAQGYDPGLPPVAAPAGRSDAPESRGPRGSTTSVGLEFDIAPTRKRHAGWTAEKQRTFIQHLSLNGHVGEACALVGIASSSAYRLKNKAGAESFSRAWDHAVRMAATRLTAIGLDWAVNGRVERHYKNGELVMERRIPCARLLTWFISRLDPLNFGSPAAQAHALASGDPCEQARRELPLLMASFEDVPEDECPTEDIDYLDERLGEAGSGEPILDSDRG